MATNDSPKQGISYSTIFAPRTENPYEGIEVGLRDVVLINAKSGQATFEQRDILAPLAMEQWQLDIFAQHYLRGQLGTPEREASVFQPMDRIAATIGKWAMYGRDMPDGTHRFRGPLFSDADAAAAWSADLRWMLANFYGVFNSPVWYNIGIDGVANQPSACFINDSDIDSMEKIADWYRTEIRIFKGGSGSGINLSMIRSSYEGITGGGKASGPCSYMRAADSSAGTLASGGRNRRAAKMTELNCDHPDLVVQANGSEGFIWLKAKAERVAHALKSAGFDMSVDSGHDAIHVQYQNANNSVRYTDAFMRALLADEDWKFQPRFADKVIKKLPEFKASEIWRQHAQASWECGDPGIQFDDLANWWNTTPAAGRVNGSNPCGEYQHIDESPCNLANTMLSKFLNEDGSWDTERFTAACRVLAIAQTVLAEYGDYPTEQIAAIARGFRQIGQGFTDLAAVFMRKALPYDSMEARAWGAVITHQMQATVGITSSEIAAVWGAYPGVAEGEYPGDHNKVLPGFDNEVNRKAHLNVVAMHADYCRAVGKRPTSSARKRSIRFGSEVRIDIFYDEVVGAGEAVKADPQLRLAWEQAQALYVRALQGGEEFGYASAYWSNIPPMGTSGIVLGQITSGLEPSYNLKVTKKKVSGDWMEIVNPLVGPAVHVLGYTPEQSATIVAYADLNNSVVNAPYLREEHYAIFDTANTEPVGGRYLSVQAHILMLAAIQPGLSGASSKTINLPNKATVEDFEAGHLQLWRMGVKAGAFYRDGSKATQPMVASEAEALAGPPPANRHKLPRTAVMKRVKITIPQPGLPAFEDYMMAGFYPNGQLGELFMQAGNEGTEINGLLSGACKQASLALQHGTPAVRVIKMWLGMKFEPHGMLSPADSDFTSCTSPLDLAAKELALVALPVEERHALGVFTRDERKNEQAAVVNQASDTSGSKVEKAAAIPLATPAVVGGSFGDTPLCYGPICGGVRMYFGGKCFICPQCGDTSGCS